MTAAGGRKRRACVQYPGVVEQHQFAGLQFEYGLQFAALEDPGVDVNRRSANDLTALMWAAGHSNDVPAAEGLAALRVLLDHGARHDLTDNRGRSALMIAAERGHAEIVAHLLSLGADPAAADKSGRTALDLAADDRVRQALE